jgi:hypothetical protein
LAFEHLRRSIVVSQDAQKSWEIAFNEREATYEKLGAVHLLSDGLWAFKATATGGATGAVNS